MHPRAFLQLDVFTARPYFGNPLAVILDAEELDGVAMQRIANWTNLSETTFLLPPTTPQADYRVRIFTPMSELPFAGHPSVGTAYAAIAAGRVDAGKTQLVQECAAGLLPVRVSGLGDERLIEVRAPDARFADADAALAPVLAEALGAGVIAARKLCNGPWWLVADLGEATTVRGLKPDLNRIAELSRRYGAVGVSVFGREGGDADADYAVRAFCPADGIPEDPVTGSANALIGAYLHATVPAYAGGTRYRASQGREIGRDGFVDVTVDGKGGVYIGGRCVICVQGSLLA